MLLLVPLSWAALTTTASAQLQVNVISFDGRSQGFNLPNLEINANAVGERECRSAEIEFRITGIDQTRASLDFWRGQNCNTVDSRNTATSDACRHLTLTVPTGIENRSEWIGKIPLSELIPCDSTTDTTVDIWVMSVNMAGSVEEIPGGQYYHMRIGYDPVPPRAPTGLVGGRGGTSFELRWQSSESRLLRYEVFVDPAGCTGGVPSQIRTDDTPMAPDPVDDGGVGDDAGMGDGGVPASDDAGMGDPEMDAGTGDDPEMDAGTGDPEMDAGAASGPTISPITTTQTQYSLVFAERGIAVGSHAAVAVRAVDRANNLGELSEVVCVERIDTTGFWDGFCADNPDDAVCSGGGCAAGPGRHSSSFPFFALALGLLMLVRRSRR